MASSRLWSGVLYSPTQFLNTWLLYNLLPPVWAETCLNNTVVWGCPLYCSNSSSCLQLCFRYQGRDDNERKRIAILLVHLHLLQIMRMHNIAVTLCNDHITSLIIDVQTNDSEKPVNTSVMYFADSRTRRLSWKQIIYSTVQLQLHTRVWFFAW